MATLVLGLAGQAIGHALLPAGLSVFGATITGAALGGAIGAYAGSHVDAWLSGSAHVEGPRLSSLTVQASTEGAPVPAVWGAARLSGQVIWAARFKETEQHHGGGKGSPSSTSYRYTASFAVGLCEGVIGGIGRVWADGKELVTDGVVMRVYRGTEDQAPDPLIEAIEGEGAVPAYRGLAYVVFEDLPLEPFGNRVPQLSFEVMRSVVAEDRLSGLVEAVCLIPGSGEFALSTTKVQRDVGYASWVPENVNNRTGRSDFEASLDQLQAQLPNVKRVALVVSWFGDDLRVGECRIRPMVELTEKRNHPFEWAVAGVSRAEAAVVSATDGRPNYGGTPSDRSVVEAILALKARGLEVMLYPFILMDVPAGNGLPDPYGSGSQAAFPWRGRITCHPAAGQPGSVDRTAAAAAQVAAFFDGEWGLRRMVLHYAGLAAEAGGVDAILIGSELRGVTTVRSGPSAYPAVGHLRALAGDVRAVVGPDCAISYAADWTEWFGHDAADGSGDFHFHLDPLWADDAVDFIGIDNYAPLADWRDGSGHLDETESPSRSVRDVSYLRRQVEGGERFDWFYASDADRAAQVRTPITDGAYGKPWVFRAKDVRSWWSESHVDRVGGVEVGAATAWVPRSKPVRFTEIGCPAVDKGANQPNVFYDPRSSESALPHHSSGVRDDGMQAAFLEALIGYWRAAPNNPVSPLYGGRMIDAGYAHVWAWDTRPFPDWPLRNGVWSDGALWRIGHWLNGRAGAAPLGVMVREICVRAGVTSVDVNGLRGACAGYALDRVMSAREALSPLMDAYGFDAAESGGVVRFFHRGEGEAIVLDAAGFAEGEEGESASLSLTRSETAMLPGAAQVAYVDALADYRVASVEARLNAAPSAKVAQVSLAVALTRGEAEGVAARMLHEAWAARDRASFALPPSRLDVEPGDAVAVGTWEGQVTRVTEAGVRLVEAVRLVRDLQPGGAVLEARLADPPPIFGPPAVVALDLAPAATGMADGLCVAVAADPWPGNISVLRASVPDGSFAEVARPAKRAMIGETLAVLHRGAPHVWDRSNALVVKLGRGALASASERQVLDGANRAAVETAPGLWEVLQFAEAELVAPGTWALRHLLRGQAGTEHAVVDALAAGARFVLLDGAVTALGIGPDEGGIDVHLRAGPAGLALGDLSYVALSVPYAAAGRRPWSPCQLKARRLDDGDLALSWVRRARDDKGLWTSEISAEDGETFRVEVLDGAEVKRSRVMEGTDVVYSAAEQAADWSGAASSPLRLRVTQVSPVFGDGVPRVADLEF